MSRNWRLVGYPALMGWAMYHAGWEAARGLPPRFTPYALLVLTPILLVLKYWRSLEAPHHDRHGIHGVGTG